MSLPWCCVKGARDRRESSRVVVLRERESAPVEWTERKLTLARCCSVVRRVTSALYLTEVSELLRRLTVARIEVSAVKTARACSDSLTKSGAVAAVLQRRGQSAIERLWKGDNSRVWRIHERPESAFLIPIGKVDATKSDREVGATTATVALHRVQVLQRSLQDLLRSV